MLRVSGGRMMVQRQRTAQGVQQEIWTRNRRPQVLVMAAWCSVKVMDQRWVASFSWI